MNRDPFNHLEDGSVFRAKDKFYSSFDGTDSMYAPLQRIWQHYMLMNKSKKQHNYTVKQCNMYIFSLQNQENNENNILSHESYNWQERSAAAASQQTEESPRCLPFNSSSFHQRP